MLCPNCGHDNLPGNETCSNCHQDLTNIDNEWWFHSELERHLSEDPASALEAPPPLTVGPSATLAEVVQLMLDNNCGAVLVVGAAGQILGIFSERDLLKKVAGVHARLDALEVKDFMTPRPETVSSTDTLNYILHKMDVGGYRHMPIVTGDGPTGMVSVRDMLRHIIEVCSGPGEG